MSWIALFGARVIGNAIYRAIFGNAPDAATRAYSALIYFVQSVVESNPRVQAARAALEASGANRDAASRPLYNLELSLDTEYSDTDTRAAGISQTLD